MAAAAAMALLLLSAACFCKLGPCNNPPPGHARIVSFATFLYPFRFQLCLITSEEGCQAAVGGDAAATELQKHVAFFDSDHDGIISFGETYRGFRALGFGVFASTLSATFVNGDIGPKTRPEHAEGSWFSIYVENIHKGIHGSDTGAFDSEGRFVSEKFNEIFTKHAKTVPDGLTSDELDEMLHANEHTEHKDSTGWLQAATEWRTTYEVAKDKDDFLRKDTVRAVYDGSFFSKLASEND